MKNKNYFKILLFVFISFLTIGVVYWFTKSPYYLLLDVWIQNNLVLYVFSICLIKILGILWPPLSGGVFTVASIPFLGWGLAFLLDFIGSLVGGAAAYYLGRKYGYIFLSKILGENVAQKIKSVKIKKGKEIEAVFMYKVLFGNVVIEAIYYGAGVLRIDFLRFMIGSVFAHLLIGIPTFYLANNIFSGKNAIMALILLFVGLLVVYKTKGRYFE